MQKVMVFGKPGGGKSTLSKRLSVATGIPYFSLDFIEFNQDGTRVPADEFLAAHSTLVSKSAWIIDGLGTLSSFWKRVDAADTLVYIDLPYSVHYWWSAKRLLKSVIVKPEGWPEGSSVLKGTLASWKYLKLSKQFWTAEFYSILQTRASHKTMVRITTVRELDEFLTRYRHA